MSTRLELLGLAAAAVTVGTIYVLVHEARRKHKKAVKMAREAPISKEMLLKILNNSADASKAVIERIRTEVRKIQTTKKLSDEQAVMLFQQNFEHSLDQLIGAIRNQYNVTEKAMDASFKMHQADPEVKQAIQNMRMLSAATPMSSASSSGAVEPAGANSPTRAGSSSSDSNAATSSGGEGPPVGVTVPASLTKDKLRQIMTFNAVMLEKELRPIKEEVEKARRQGKTVQVDPSLLMGVQERISQAVYERYGFKDDQVMTAVEAFGAKNDPSFKDILQRIATTLSTCLG